MIKYLGEGAMAYNQELIVDFPEVAHIGKDQWIYLEIQMENNAKQYLRISLNALPTLRKHIDSVEQQKGLVQPSKLVAAGS